MFLRWQNFLPEGTEIAGIQLPGRENRMSEPYANSLDEVLEHLVPDIEALLDVPYIFFGHSFGALIAMELAQRLVTASLSLPEKIIVSAANPPDRQLALPIDRMDDAELLAAVRTWGGNRIDGFGAEFMAFALAALRADFALLHSHTYSLKKIPVPLLALGGTEDVLVPKESLPGWSRMGMSCETVLLNGGHFFFEHQLETIASFVMQAFHSSKRTTVPLRHDIFESS